MPRFPERDSLLEAKLKKQMVSDIYNIVWCGRRRRWMWCCGTLLPAGNDRGGGLVGDCRAARHGHDMYALPACNTMTFTTACIGCLQEEGQDKDAWGVAEKEEEGAGENGANGESNPDNEGSDDEHDGGSGAYAASSAAPAAAASNDNTDADDLLGLGSAAPAPAPAAVDPLSVPVTKRIAVEDPAKLEANLQALTIKPAAVLYEDQYVQVGVKHAYKAGEARIGLFIGNKTSVPLVAVKVRVPEVAYVKATVGDVPASIQPRAQAQVQISLDCMLPFTEQPQLQFSFISEPGTGHAYALKLPISVAQFCEKVEMNGADFRTRWSAMAGAPKEVTAVIRPASGNAAAVSSATALKALEVVNMASVDAGAPGATGVSSFKSKTIAANGAAISVGCLAMIIPDANGGCFKVAVRTQHGDVSKSIMATLQYQLGSLL